MTAGKHIIALLFGTVFSGLAAEAPKPAQVMGLLKTNCIGCHNTEKKKGGLSLETRADALKGGENGASLIVGKSAESVLIKQLAEGADPHMPPKKQLAEKHIALLQAWVDGGVAWDEKAMKSFGEVAPAEKLGPLPQTRQPVLALTLSPDGTKLAIASGSKVLVQDVSKPERPLVATLEGHRDLVQSIAWSADGKSIAAGGYRTVLVFDTASWKVTHTLTQPLEGRITALAFLADNQTLAMADGAQGQRGLLQLWKLAEPKPLATIDAHKDNILSIAVGRTGKVIATGGADCAVKLWDIATHKELAKLEGHTNHVLALAFNKDDTWLATGGADKELKIWDTKTKDQLVQLGGKTSPVTGLHWLADGTQLIAISEDGKARGYTDFVAHTGGQTTETAKEKKLPAADAQLYSVTTSLDGKTVYAGSDEGVVFTWTPDGKLSNTGSQPVGSTGILPVSDAAGTLPTANIAVPPVSFMRDVLPILSKAGCNAGACHAKASGQAGFKLSIFAFDPKSDHRQLTKDSRGRRVFPALPEESLMLRKATGSIAHEGGQRLEPGSDSFRKIADWIRQGAVYESPNEPALLGIEAAPAEKTYAKNSAQQLKVTARYSDGSMRDVTALADYQSNEKGIATVSDEGLIKSSTYSGEAVAIARFMGMVAVSQINIPAEKTLPDSAYAALPVNNETDRLVYARLKKLGYLPSEQCSDAEFMRRAALDATGTVPSAEEARAFLDSKDPKKREQWIEKLLLSPAWADHWAVKWADLLRPNPYRVGVKPVMLFDDWLHQSFRTNKPWNQIVRELLTAQGGSHQYGPVAVWRDKREPADAASFVGQIILGVRLECAKCHHHPSERWDMSDYYQLAAFFTQMKHKGQGISPPISGEPEYWWFERGLASIKHPVTSAALKPRPLGAADVTIPEEVDPRSALADWMTRADNPFFAKALVNRVWNSFFGKGIVDPVDDFRASNPPSNAPLLDWLAKDFVAHGYDLKHLMRTIMRSHVYQLSSLPNATNIADTRNYSRSYRRRLPAEVLLDAVSTVTETTEVFTSLPLGSSAKQNWNVLLASEFMDAFGRPNSSAECPCERDAKPSVVQALHLMNSSRLQKRLTDEKGRVARLTKSTMTPEQIVEELYLAVFSRKPVPEEQDVALKVLAASEGDKKQGAIEDVLWALLNSAEFVFNH